MQILGTANRGDSWGKGRGVQGLSHMTKEISEHCHRITKGGDTCFSCHRGGEIVVIMKSGYQKFFTLLLGIPQLLPCGFCTCLEPAVGILSSENCETSNECPVYPKNRPKLNLVAGFTLGCALVNSFNIPAQCICGIRL